MGGSLDKTRLSQLRCNLVEIFDADRAALDVGVRPRDAFDLEAAVENEELASLLEGVACLDERAGCVFCFDDNRCFRKS